MVSVFSGCPSRGGWGIVNKVLYGEAPSRGSTPYPFKFCISVVFNSSRNGCNSQEKWKPKVMQNFEGHTRCIMGDMQMKKSCTFFPTVRALIGLGLATRPSCPTIGESVKCRIECLQTFIEWTLSHIIEWIFVKLSNECCGIFWKNIVVNYGISKSSNEYCGALSNGFVLNYRMNINANDRMDLN